MVEKEVLEKWFIKAPTEYPWWKKIIWQTFGVKRVVCDSDYQVTMYYFNGIYLVTKCEFTGSSSV